MVLRTVLGRVFRRRYGSLIFEITPRCNLNCLHCFNVWRGDNPYPAGELPTNAVMDLLDGVLRETGARNVALTGGEPLLRSDIEDVVRLLRGRRVRTTLLTNGLLLDQGRAHRLVRAGVHNFEIPLLSVSSDVHNSLARGDSHRSALDAIGNVRAARGRVVVVFVATKANLRDLPATLELCVGMGVDGILLNRFNPGGVGAESRADLMPGAEELALALSAADDVAKRYGIPPCPSRPASSTPASIAT